MLVHSNVPVCVIITDAGSLQVSTHLEASSQGQARDDAALRSKVTQDADQISGPTVAQV